MPKRRSLQRFIPGAAVAAVTLAALAAIWASSGRL